MRQHGAQTVKTEPGQNRQVRQERQGERRNGEGRGGSHEDKKITKRPGTAKTAKVGSVIPTEVEESLSFYQLQTDAVSP